MIWYHVYCANHWYDVVAESLMAIKRAEIPGTVRVQLVGSLLDEFHFRELATIIGVDCDVMRSSVNKFEYPAIRDIWQCSQNQDGPACYMHSKGVTNPSPVFTKWRWMMTDKILHEWKDRVEDLKSYDAVGCCLCTRWKNHEFAGNFWWARHEWIRSLPEPIITHDRMYYEDWLLSVSPVRAKTLIAQNSEPCQASFYTTNGNPHQQFLEKAVHGILD